MNSFEYLRTSPLYNLPPEIGCGTPCDMDGEYGVVTGEDDGYVQIRFDGDNYSKPCHPHWQMTYYNEDRSVLKDYKQHERIHNA